MQLFIENKSLLQLKVKRIGKVINKIKCNAYVYHKRTCIISICFVQHSLSCAHVRWRAVAVEPWSNGGQNFPLKLFGKLAFLRLKAVPFDFRLLHCFRQHCWKPSALRHKNKE